MSLSIISCNGQTPVSNKPYLSLSGKDTVVNNLPIVFLRRANVEHIRLGAALVDLDSCESNRQVSLVALQKTDSNWRATEQQLLNMEIQRDNNMVNYNRERRKVDELTLKNKRLAKLWKSLTGVLVSLSAGCLGVGYYFGTR